MIHTVHVMYICHVRVFTMHTDIIGGRFWCYCCYSFVHNTCKLLLSASISVEPSPQHGLPVDSQVWICSVQSEILRNLEMRNRRVLNLEIILYSFGLHDCFLSVGSLLTYILPPPLSSVHCLLLLQ